MNTLHHGRFVSGTLTTGGPITPVTRLLGYLDLNQLFAAKYGRSMSPMAIFDLVAYRAHVLLAGIGAGTNPAPGAGAQGNINYVEPGSTRIKAMKEARERWHAEMLETDTAATAKQLTRDRQFYFKYDDEMPTTPYHSLTETAAGVDQPIVMIDRGVAAAWGMFDDWNARNPRWPAPTTTEDGVLPADPRLYTLPCSEIEGVLGWSAYSSVGIGPDATTNELWTSIANGQDWCIAPAGTAWPVLGGVLRIEIDEITPPADQIAAAQDDASFFVIIETYTAGWRPVEGGAKGIRSSRRR